MLNRKVGSIWLSKSKVTNHSEENWQMNGIIGHVMYAILGVKAAVERELPIASIAGRHWASYLAGSYLACDIQTMPEAICTEKGQEVGRKVLGLHWESLLTDLAETPIEPVQLHGKRVALQRGKLARDFPYGWVPEKKALLQAVLQENRRYLKIYMVSLLKELELHQKSDHLECSSSMQAASGGLSCVQMIELAEKARFRNALWQMGEAVADLFQAVTERVEALRKLSRNPPLTWTELKENWKPPPSKELP